ncbi:MAG: CD1871A family CXXC motif-containing protein [Clostridia bacterium]
MAWIRRNLPALLLLLCGAACIVAGIYRREVDTILRKAIKLCLECVGIG